MPVKLLTPAELIRQAEPNQEQKDALVNFINAKLILDAKSGRLAHRSRSKGAGLTLPLDSLTKAAGGAMVTRQYIQILSQEWEVSENDGSIVFNEKKQSWHNQNDR